MTPEQAIETINQIMMTPKNLHALNGEETIILIRSITAIREALKPKEKPE